jgi:hypothetical protein
MSIHAEAAAQALEDRGEGHQRLFLHCSDCPAEWSALTNGWGELEDDRCPDCGGPGVSA